MWAPFAAATTILIDFGRADNQTVEGNFNNVSGTGTGLDTPMVELIDSEGGETGISLEVDFSGGGSWAGEQADYAGPFPDELAGLPETALQDSMFIRSPASSLFFFSGLDAGLTYDILIYGARSNNGGPDSEWTFTDASGDAMIGFDVFENATEVALFEGLVPDANNQLILRFSSTADGTLPRGAMNFMQIFVGGAPTKNPLEITSIDLDREGEDPTYTVTCSSVPDREYALFFSTDLETWEEASDGILSGGESTSYPHKLLPFHSELITAPTLFYQVSLLDGN